jgi:phosphomannomutase/phosphoglucomutase
LTEGLLSTGINVIDLGMVATPMVYFGANQTLNGKKPKSGIMITGSHNPPNYNGFKMVLGGAAIYGDQIQALRKRIEEKKFATGQGSRSEFDIFPMYLERIVGDVKLARPIKIAVDCGNGVGGAFAGKLFRALGCEVQELFCEVDGHFPNHHPDPSIPENLNDLIASVKQHQADIGLALDGDGDRLGVVTNRGEIIWPDRQMMLYAMDVLSRHPGALIIYDIKSTGHLAKLIAENDGQSLMWKTGHSIMKSKLEETGALLAGEMSGHIFFKERWYGFDDGLYTAARLLEIVAKSKKNISDLFAELPNSINTPELKLPIAEDKKFAFIQAFQAHVNFPEATLSKIDGVRAEFSDGWGLVRASNTSPYLILRFEADNLPALKRIQTLFRNALLAMDPDLKLPF